MMRRVSMFSVLALAGCGWGAINDDEFEREYGVSLSSLAYAGDDNYEAGVIERRLAEIREVTNPDPKVAEVRIYPGIVSMVVQSEKNPANFDTYTIYDTRLDDPRVATGTYSPVPLSIIEPALKRVPEIVRKAILGTEFNINQVNLVSVQAFASAPPVLQVSMDNKRRSLSVTFDATGNRLSPP